MANMIIPTALSDNVYGVQQYAYTVSGVSGQDYIAALSAASFKQSVAIEETASAYAATIRQRQRKVTDIGVALSCLNAAMADMDPKSNDPDKKGSFSGLATAATTVAQYGLSLNNSGDSISYRNATTAQSNLQYALDIENNNLQQDMVSLQSMISKRDNAFSTASKLVNKANKAATNTISNFQ